LLVNSNRKDTEAALPLSPNTFLTTLTMDSEKPTEDYPTTFQKNSVSYSDPFVEVKDDNILVIQKRIGASSAKMFYPGIYVNNKEPKSYILSNEPNPSLDKAFLGGFQTSPVPTGDGGSSPSYYVATVDRDTNAMSNSTLYPYIMKIPTVNGQAGAVSWFIKLDQITSNSLTNETSEAPSAPLVANSVANSSIYFKSNYKLGATATTASPKVFILSTDGSKINSSWPLNSSKSNLLLSLDTQYLFIGDDDGLIHVYNALSGKEYETIKFNSAGSCINNIQLSQNGNTIYALTDRGVYAFDITNMLSTGTITAKNFQFPTTGMASTLHNMVLSVSHNVLYAANGPSIYALDTNNLSPLWSSTFVSPIAGNITALLLAPSDNTIYAGTDGGTVYSFQTILAGSAFYILN
ncbi:MAG: hypothetical protein V4591_00010, partial [Bdellovibrionota bacterium]